MARRMPASPDCSGMCRWGATTGVSETAASRSSSTVPGSIEEMRRRAIPSIAPTARTRAARPAPESGSR